jgi:hypothetical protein
VSGDSDRDEAGRSGADEEIELVFRVSRERLIMSFLGGSVVGPPSALGVGRTESVELLLRASIGVWQV